MIVDWLLLAIVLFFRSYQGRAWAREVRAQETSTEARDKSCRSRKNAGALTESGINHY